MVLFLNFIQIKNKFGNSLLYEKDNYSPVMVSSSSVYMLSYLELIRHHS